MHFFNDAPTKQRLFSFQIPIKIKKVVVFRYVAIYIPCQAHHSNVIRNAAFVII